ncbi:hypothetical protein LOK74_16530 [Brevibacillus humidisoli]|uniref:hypothetical protein n=1 Tax=Brevibacillus humidisoli TaxID=2895522 RepID=UPI001E435612|nr:hypothetical protein [Brevibacillus humidisoli]UFJ39651.1 hypothetical protein LOK74_16530 [Brevibacillus humidisoli]
MELNMSTEQVQHRIRQIKEEGKNLSKKAVKNTDPELMRHALFYYSTWDRALEASEQI